MVFLKDQGANTEEKMHVNIVHSRNYKNINKIINVMPN